LDAALEEALAVAGNQNKSSQRFEYWETLAEIREARKELKEALIAWKHAINFLKESDPLRSKVVAKIKDLESQ
jgi:hypothetical protein